MVVVSLGLALVFGVLYHAMYWRWRGCFDDAGRCFVPGHGVVYNAQSGVVYLSLTLVCAGVALIGFVLMARSRTVKAPRPDL